MVVNPEWTNDDITLNTVNPPKYTFRIATSEINEPSVRSESESD